MTPNSEARISFWRQSIPLLGNFYWTGVGLLGFGPTYMKYQAAMTANRVDFTHNDYLEYLIELGVFGFAFAASALAGLLLPAFAALLRARRANRDGTDLLIGCVAAFVSVGLHEIVDFNFYVPTVMLVFAWIAGFASAKAAEV